MHAAQVKHVEIVKIILPIVTTKYVHTISAKLLESTNTDPNKQAACPPLGLGAAPEVVGRSQVLVLVSKMTNPLSRSSLLFPPKMIMRSSLQKSGSQTTHNTHFITHVWKIRGSIQVTVLMTLKVRFSPWVTSIIVDHTQIEQIHFWILCVKQMCQDSTLTSRNTSWKPPMIHTNCPFCAHTWAANAGGTSLSSALHRTVDHAQEAVG